MKTKIFYTRELISTKRPVQKKNMYAYINLGIGAIT